MKKFFGFLLIMFALLFCYSCTENEEMTKQTDKLTYELSFKFAIEDPEVKGIDWDMAYDDESEAAECPDPDNFINTISGYFAVAYLDMSGDESITRVVLKLRKINDLTGHSYISTVPVALAAKTGVKMYLNRIVIVKDLNANGELDVEDELVNSNIVYSTLNETSPYKEYVDILTPIELSFEGENSNLVAFNKREIGVQVFCAVKATPAAMGYAMFTLDAVKSDRKSVV